jgi:dynactin-4
MAAPFPYAHYACPCSTSNGPASSKRASQLEPQDEDTFNPHDARAAYALYPLDNLLFCDECSQIRCQKCVNDEIITWFCPSCLFDVPSGQVRGENNRCARNCYNCPSCTSPLHVTQVEKQATGLEDGAAGEEAYLLFCQYCDWTTLDIGLQFSRPTKITEQINKARKARYNVQEQAAPEEGGTALPRPKELRSHEGAFVKLSAFYKEQMNETGEGQNPYGNSTYGSPANLARIMSIYGGLTNNALKKSREKPQPMREAAGDGEGFAVYTAEDSTSEDNIVQRMQKLGWEGTVSEEQALSTPANYNARFNDELWPAAMQELSPVHRKTRAQSKWPAVQDPHLSTQQHPEAIIATSPSHWTSSAPFVCFAGRTIIPGAKTQAAFHSAVHPHATKPDIRGSEGHACNTSDHSRSSWIQSHHSMSFVHNRSSWRRLG